jgi:hypothetical protein
MEQESSLPLSQQPATCPCPERNQSSPRPQPISWRSSLILPSIYVWASKWSLSLKFPHQNPLCTSPLTHTRNMPCPSHSSRSSEWYLITITEYKAPCYVIFSTPLLPRPSKAQTPSSAPHSQTPSAYAPPSMKKTKTQTHTKWYARL